MHYHYRDRRLIGQPASPSKGNVDFDLDLQSKWPSNTTLPLLQNLERKHADVQDFEVHGQSLGITETKLISH